VDLETQQVVLHGIVERAVERPETDGHAAKFGEGALEMLDRPEMVGPVVNVEWSCEWELREQTDHPVVVGFQVTVEFVDGQVEVVVGGVFFVDGVDQLDLDDVLERRGDVDDVLGRVGVERGVSESAVHRVIVDLDRDLFFNVTAHRIWYMYMCTTNMFWKA